MTRVAAIDCGTNSIRLLIAERDADARSGLRELDRQTVVVRLGQGVDATGEFHPDALTRTFAATDDFAARIRAAGVPVDHVHFVATSASRDARNRQVFFDGIADRVGVVPEVISGDTEATLSFTGALVSQRGTDEPIMVMDLGGGSTELIIGSADGSITAARSLDIGSVRLTERFLRSHPVPEDRLAAAAGYVDGLLDDSGLPLDTARTWVGVAGTVTTLAALELGLTTYDRSRVHGAVLAREAVSRWLEVFARSEVEQIRALPSMHPGRADVITAGALIVDRVARRVPAPALTVSETDILDGIALALLDRVA